MLNLKLENAPKTLVGVSLEGTLVMVCLHDAQSRHLVL